MVTHSKFDSAMSSSHLDSNMRLPQRYKTFTSKAQYQMVLSTIHKLQESGFYWGAINGKEANAMLASESTGTFLIRDSSDNRHLFTLSVKTVSGTKNLRVQCDPSSFFLQTDPKNIQSVPHFDCILKLVHYYMPQSKGNTRSGSTYYIYSGGEKIPLELIKPLSCSLSTLQHLCRKTVNGHLDISSKRDQLPHPLKEFLQEYDAPIQRLQTDALEGAETKPGKEKVEGFSSVSEGSKVRTEQFRASQKSAFGWFEDYKEGQDTHRVMLM